MTVNKEMVVTSAFPEKIHFLLIYSKNRNANFFTYYTLKYFPEEASIITLDKCENVQF